VLEYKGRVIVEGKVMDGLVLEVTGGVNGPIKISYCLLDDGLILWWDPVVGCLPHEQLQMVSCDIWVDWRVQEVE
jgi:hypothetical protein